MLASHAASGQGKEARCASCVGRLGEAVLREGEAETSLNDEGSSHS